MRNKKRSCWDAVERILEETDKSDQEEEDEKREASGSRKWRFRFEEERCEEPLLIRRILDLRCTD